jgi:hypothetical protein
MTFGIPANTPQDSEHLTVEKATVFLRLGLEGPRRPVDDLIDRLRRSSGGSWLNDALQAGPLKGQGSASELLIDGKATIAQLIAIKDRSKALVKEAVAGELRLAGIAGYFLSIAAGLQHHGKLITTRDHDQLAEILLDLAEAAPEPFKGLLSHAAVREPSV